MFMSWEGAENESKAVRGSPPRTEWRALDRAWVNLGVFLQGSAASVGQAEVWAQDLLL